MRAPLKPHGRISLTFFISLCCVGIALLPVVVYSALSMLFFRTGIDSLHEAQLKSAIEQYACRQEDAPGKAQTPGTAGVGSASAAPGPVSASGEGISRLHVTTRLAQLPLRAREALSRTPEHDDGHTSVIADGSGNSGNLYAVLSMEVRGTRYYAWQTVPFREGEAYIKPQILSTISILLATGALMLVLLGVFLLYVIRRIKQPTRALHAWTARLTPETIDQPLPDFVYPEVSAIALMIQESLKRQYATVRREELIWRYCSHELRTPISIMQVGLDLLKKISGRQERDSGQEIRILSRLQRSISSMAHLINTLLWLGRDDAHPLPHEHIELSLFLQSVIDDLRPLFPQGQKTIVLKKRRHVLCIPAPALRIVLENIIRNAFQHAQGKTIVIIQRGGRITVTNTTGGENGVPEHTGFGLGLELTERLAAKLGWGFSITRGRGFARAVLALPA